MIKINNWSESFESADTRKRQRLGWFLSPTGCDSKGYRMLMREGQQGVIALGVFQALCQIMGTLSKDIRKSGILANSDGTGMEVADLWEITRIDVADLEHSLELLEKVKWLTVEVKDVKGESAGDVPPICHSSAGDVPKNSGFVQGEGEEQEEVPPKSPKGDWDGVFPNGSLRKSKTDQKRIKVIRSNEKMQYVGQWFGRKPETLWNVSEAKALRDLNPPKDEVIEMGEFLQSDYDFHRSNLMTTLNNWSSDLDKARKNKTNKRKSCL